MSYTKYSKTAPNKRYLGEDFYGLEGELLNEEQYQEVKLYHIKKNTPHPLRYEYAKAAMYDKDNEDFVPVGPSPTLYHEAVREALTST